MTNLRSSETGNHVAKPKPKLRPVIVEKWPYNAETPLKVLAESDITPNSSFYVRNHFAVPRINTSRWKLKVTGAVERQLGLSLQEIRSLPSRTLTATMECAGNSRMRMSPRPPGTPWRDGAVGTAAWTGVPLRGIIESARPLNGVVEVAFKGADHGMEGGQHLAFERSLPLEDALAGDVILAYEMNGRSLPRVHGFPLRLIVPGWYGVASVKWLTEISLLREPFLGWFQSSRYIYADRTKVSGGPVSRMMVKSLILEPVEGARIRCNQKQIISGLAWSGFGAVRKVEVMVNNSRWRPARIVGNHGSYGWKRWITTLIPRKPGNYKIISRATDSEGNRQPLSDTWNSFGYGYNTATPVTVQVRKP